LSSPSRSCDRRAIITLSLVDQIGSFATAIGVLLASWQLRRTAIQARTDFEDRVVEEYRVIARRIPVDALLGAALPPDEQARCLDAFYHYIDLSNEQVFLRMTRRVSKATWQNWRDGIRSHLERPAFDDAWKDIKTRAGQNFRELRLLEQSNFEGDPATWVRSRPRDRT
jgi:hypothetical protein